MESSGETSAGGGASAPTVWPQPILHLGKVPVIDSTGLVALDNAIGAVARGRRAIVIAGPLPHPRRVFDKAHLQRKHPTLHLAQNLEEALPLAARLAEERLGSRTSLTAPAARGA